MCKSRQREAIACRDHVACEFRRENKFFQAFSTRTFRVAVLPLVKVLTK